ncbi:hypothetical protein H8L32_11580 [Undibacterium sp. CY18W]|uniref:Secreted protein n=1 Tax=Undibacterium hunanense TaxID=2762292 RepID=A0ABR6ZRI1_9BURK|nr:hypothetical protein [Undibacterium hunanense]MBC3918120.1 hypothetical protein [Undibacterium hunanense]
MRKQKAHQRRAFSMLAFCCHSGAKTALNNPNLMAIKNTKSLILNIILVESAGVGNPGQPWHVHAPFRGLAACGSNSSLSTHKVRNLILKFQ